MHAQEWLAEPSARAGRPAIPPKRSAAARFIWKWTTQNAVNCFTTDFGSHGLNGVVEKRPTGTPRRLGIGGEWKGGKHRVGKPIKPFRSVKLTAVRNFRTNLQCVRLKYHPNYFYFLK